MAKTQPRARALELLCLLLLALPARAAWSQATADFRDEARRLMAEGAGLYGAGKLDAALAKFEAAYALVRSPKLRFNLALTLRGLGREVEAAEHFRAFLRESKAQTGAEPVEASEDAQRELDELRMRLGTLEVVADVDGARVYAGGRFAGTTPLREPLFVEAGQLQLELSKAGHQTHRESVLIERGKTLRVAVGLGPLTKPASALPTRPAPRSSADVSLATTAPPPARARRLFFAFGAGVGAGWVKGRPELNPNYSVGNPQQVRSIEVSNIAAARLFHVLPEVGYFVTPRLLVSAQMRLQFMTGASEVRHASCNAERPTVCDPATGAAALFARTTFAFAPDGPFQPYVSAAAGFGRIRHVVDISSYRLEGCGNVEGTDCHDTLASGAYWLGPAAGLWYRLGESLYANVALTLLVGMPSPAVNADLNLGLGYRL
jgi:hypothetical protein